MAVLDVQRIRQIMKEKNITIKELAVNMGVYTQYAYDLLSPRKSSSRTLKTISKLAKALGVSVRDIIKNGE